MKRYQQGASHLLCGHWNGSPIEIGLTGRMRGVPRGEVEHYHEYREYYLVLEGRGTLMVEGQDVPLEANTLILVEPRERHRVTWVDPVEGIRWVLIKEVSAPNSKVVVGEPDRTVAPSGAPAG